MKDISIKLTVDHPGMAFRYVGEARITDESQGYHTTDDGFNVLNYDKAFTVGCDHLDFLIDSMGERLTEELCS